MSKILNKIQDFILSRDLLNKEKLYLIALSGGADSVCLLLIMKKLGYRIEAIHCNFHLRGDESDRDENFCKNLCTHEKVPFHLVHFDTKSYAELHKVSIEMAARELRYNYFEHLRQDINAEGIIVAHHRDDSVETLLLNLIRGTGIHGLQGIKPRNGRIIRPMLCISRNDIEDYLKEEKQNYVTDSTNLIDNVLRNKIRLNVIPLLKTINPSVSDNIARTALNMTEASNIYDQTIEKAANSVLNFTEGITTIDTERLSTYNFTQSILFYILQPLNFNPTQIKEIANSNFTLSGKKWNSSTHNLVIDRKVILIREIKKEANKIFKIPETGTYILNENEYQTEKITLKELLIDSAFKISKERNCVCFDASKIVFPLILRHIEQGDRFQPFGMKGKKLVNEYLTDHKKSIFEKEDQLVLSDGYGRVVWLVGERPDANFCITKDTINSIIIRYYK